MDELFKKLLYAGVGLMAVTAEKLQDTVDRFVDDGKLSREDGASMLQELKAQTETRREEVEDRVRDFLERTYERFNFVPRSEYEKLETRVTQLEAKLEGLKQKPSATASKTVAKRTVKKIETKS